MVEAQHQIAAATHTFFFSDNWTNIIFAYDLQRKKLAMRRHECYDEFKSFVTLRVVNDFYAFSESMDKLEVMTAYKYKNATSSDVVAAEIIKEELACAAANRFGGALALYKERFVYFTGGQVDSHVSNSVECFSIDTNEFTQVQHLTKSRWSHSSTTLGEKLYVIAGMGFQDKFIKSIEVLDLAPREAGQAEAAFEVMEFPALTPRSIPIVCPIGDTKLLICGGSKSPDQFFDVILFDTETRTGEKIADAPFSVVGLRNQTFFERDGKVILSLMRGPVNVARNKANIFVTSFDLATQEFEVLAEDL